MSGDTQQDLRRRIAAAAIEAAEARLAVYGQHGVDVPGRAELVASVVVEALSWFEMDHDETWDAASWAESAEGAVEFIQQPEQVARVIARRLPFAPPRP